MSEDDIVSLVKQLKLLTPSQIDWVKNVMAQFAFPFKFTPNPKSDWITPAVLQAIGDMLRVHHALSRQPLTKDRFEFGFERALNLANIKAELVTNRTNRGHDITIAGAPVSLKTEAAAGIHANIIHISKWMELGKGEWKLTLLRDTFLDHLKSYDRIFTMRCLKSKTPHCAYELVEIPKSLLLEAKNCKLETMKNSRQSPKPGYGYVQDQAGNVKYSLYFDGGTERKLQIKHLQKSLCTVHATWEFESAPF